MRWHRWRWSGWAAWLGVIALGLNALVPIHFAFDLAEALNPAHHAPEIGDGIERHLLALICGHEEGGDSGHHGKRGDRGCPVCAAVGTLIAFAPATGAAFPFPVAIATRVSAAATAALSHATPAAAYRSRAPPVA